MKKKRLEQQHPKNDKEHSGERRIYKQLSTTVIINAVNNDEKLIGRILDTQEKYLAQQAHASPLSYRNASPAFSSNHEDMKIEGRPVTTLKSSPKNSKDGKTASALAASAIASKRELLAITNSRKAIEKEDVADEKSEKDQIAMPESSAFG